MELTDKQLNRLYNIFRQMLDDTTILDADIFPTGYREFDIGYFELSLNENMLVDAVIDALREE
jgi:hypothetical protein